MKNNTELKDTGKILPKELKAMLWSKDIKDIDPEADKVYIIHQVLSYGDIDEIESLLKFYSPEKVKNIFINLPKAVYTKPVFLFVKNYLLRVSKELEEKYYVKNLYKSVE